MPWTESARLAAALPAGRAHLHLLDSLAVIRPLRQQLAGRTPADGQGMRLLDVSLLDLVNQGVVEGADAYFAADNKGPFEQWAPRAEGFTLQG